MKEETPFNPINIPDLAAPSSGPSIRAGCSTPHWRSRSADVATRVTRWFAPAAMADWAWSRAVGAVSISCAAGTPGAAGVATAATAPTRYQEGCRAAPHV